MFLVSLKSLKGKLFLLIAAVVAIVIVCAIISASGNTEQSEPTDNTLDFSASTEAERMNFIAALGLTTDNEPSSVTEIKIPEEFDETYTNYNEIQKQSGLDLEPYKGCAVKKWTYTVKNYPGYEKSQSIRVNLLVYKGKIIGGDICSLEIDGFMKGLTKQELSWEKNESTS